MRNPNRGGGVGSQEGRARGMRGGDGERRRCGSVSGPPPSSDATQSVSKSCSCKYCVLPVPFVLSLS